MSSISSKRLAKELKEFHTVNLVGVTLLKAEDFKQWLVGIEVMGESLYQNEVFALRFTFDAQYPISSPEVVFIDDGKHHIPMHPHVYSNGHICASILGQEWSPVLSVASVCITLQSITKNDQEITNDMYGMHLYLRKIPGFITMTTQYKDRCLAVATLCKNNN